MAAVLGLSPAGVHLAERLDLWTADPLLLLPARVTRRKRVEAAIAATAALRGRGRNAALVVTALPGPHNPVYARYLAALISLANAEGRVHLLYPIRIRAP